MHWIQRHILQQLTLNEYQRYSDLRPEGVEGNLFMYHLEELISDGLVNKQEKEYTLSNKGRKHAGYMSIDTGAPSKQPKITTTIVAENEDSEFLLFKWQRQPFIHQTSFIYGKTSFGKSIWDNVEHELKTKASVTAEAEWIGDVYVQMIEDDMTLNHMLTHVFSTTDVEGKAESQVPTGECFWGKIEDFDEEDLVPGTSEILDLYQNAKRPFLDEVVVEVSS